MPLSSDRSSVAFNKVKVSKGFGLFGGKLVLTPSFNVKDSSQDLKAVYATSGDKMIFGVDATTNGAQRLTVDRAFGDKTVISPSITTDKDFSLTVLQKTDIGEITGTFRPNKSLHFRWKEGSWVGNIVAPIEGYSYRGIKVDIKKNLEFD